MNDGILAYLCPTEYSSIYDDAFDACIVKGDIVYMSVRPHNNDYVDDQKVTLPDDKCFIADGTYTYTTVKNLQKRVRKIKIMNSQIPNPDTGTNKKK